MQFPIRRFNHTCTLLEQLCWFDAALAHELYALIETRHERDQVMFSVF